MGQVRDTKFGANISNKMLLNAAKFQGKPTGGKTIPFPHQAD